MGEQTDKVEAHLSRKFIYGLALIVIGDLMLGAVGFYMNTIILAKDVEHLKNHQHPDHEERLIVLETLQSEQALAIKRVVDLVDNIAREQSKRTNPVYDTAKELREHIKGHRSN